METVPVDFKSKSFYSYWTARIDTSRFITGYRVDLIDCLYFETEGGLYKVTIDVKAFDHFSATRIECRDIKKVETESIFVPLDIKCLYKQQEFTVPVKSFWDKLFGNSQKKIKKSKKNYQV